MTGFSGSAGFAAKNRQPGLLSHLLPHLVNLVQPVKSRVLPLWLSPLLLASCANLPEGSPREAREEKSLLVGELLAVFPGILVHGTGHRYAGNVDKANEILAMEGYSLLTAGIGGGLYAVGVTQDAKAVEIAGWVGIGVGGVAFLGTWIYDLVYTPSEIDRYNRQLTAHN